MKLQDTRDGFIRSGRVRYFSDLEPLMKPIDSVSPAPWNYNNGDVEAVTQSVQVNGMFRPIYVQRSSGHVIAGNHTWMACKSLGADAIPVVLLDVDDIQARKIMVADNQIAKMAQPDNGLLLALLDEIKEVDELTGTGVDDEFLETLRHLNEIPLDTDEFGQWPTFSVKVHPNVLRGFMYLTREADTDAQRFELLLRMAGWDGTIE